MGGVKKNGGLTLFQQDSRGGRHWNCIIRIGENVPRLRNHPKYCNLYGWVPSIGESMEV